MADVTVTTLNADGSLTTESTSETQAASPAPAGETSGPSAPAPDQAAPVDADVAPVASAPTPDDTDTETETGETEEESPPATRPQPSSVNRAMARLRRENSEANARAAELAERVRLFETGRLRPAESSPAPAPEPRPQGPPQQQDYATDTEWYGALAQFEARAAVEAYKREQIEAQAMQAQQLRAQALHERQATFRQTHPDYDEVLAERLTGRISPQLFYQLANDEDGPALAYLLAHEPAEVQRLNALDAYAQARALGQLAARLNGTNGTRTPSVSPVPTILPTPLTPVSGAGSGAPTTYTEDMDQREFDRLFPYKPRRR